MKDDYTAVFRNLKADRTTGHHKPYHEPWLVSASGGILLGFAFFFMLYLWATI